MTLLYSSAKMNATMWKIISSKKNSEFKEGPHCHQKKSRLNYIPHWDIFWQSSNIAERSLECFQAAWKYHFYSSHHCSSSSCHQVCREGPYLTYNPLTKFAFVYRTKTFQLTLFSYSSPKSDDSDYYFNRYKESVLLLCILDGFPIVKSFAIWRFPSA